METPMMGKRGKRHGRQESKGWRQTDIQYKSSQDSCPMHKLIWNDIGDDLLASTFLLPFLPYSVECRRENQLDIVGRIKIELIRQNNVTQQQNILSILNRF